MKGKLTIVLTENQRRGLSQEARRFGIGISEFLRRAFDDPGVREAIGRLPMYQMAESPTVAAEEVIPEMQMAGSVRRVSRA